MAARPMKTTFVFCALAAAILAGSPATHAHGGESDGGGGASAASIGKQVAEVCSTIGTRPSIAPRLPGCTHSARACSTR
jgi:hypothetical protein